MIRSESASVTDFEREFPSLCFALATGVGKSDPERLLAIVLDRDSQRWFKPAKGQFQMFYRWNGEHPEYQPDFVAETANGIYMLEPKRKSDLEDPEVQLKKEVAVRKCLRLQPLDRWEALDLRADTP